MASAKPGKMTSVWPATGRTMECSTAAFESTWRDQGWLAAGGVVSQPDPDPEPEPSPEPAKKGRGRGKGG